MTTSNGTKSGYAEIHGGRLYYEVTGEGHPLVLLHAGLMNLRMWDNQVIGLAPYYRVIRYDLRGMGASDVPTSPYSNEEDLHGILNFLGIERAYILGLSFGGRTAINFTLEHPEMVDALILAAASLQGFQFSEANQNIWAEVDEAIEKGDLALATELETRMWIDGPERTPEQVDPVVRKLVYDWNLHNLKLGLQKGVVEPTQMDPPAIGRLGEIATPTLVIVGDKDVHDAQTVAEILSREIAGAKKVVIPGAAHALNMEKPGEFNQVVLDFLEGL